VNRAGLIARVAMGVSVRQLVLLGASLFVISSLALGQAPAVADAEQAQAGAAPANRPHDDTFVIGIDDVLAINVWKEADLTRTIPVRSDGKISLPLVGELDAAGKTPSQLERAISDKLRNYITDPEVTVMVEQVNSKKFNILGQVAKPGTYSIAIAPTVMDAIAAAGGFRDFAKVKGVYILRQNPDGTETRIPFNYSKFIKSKNRPDNIRLEPHDTVIVP
jgi:polysaccharide export outer membrane protein